jgi:hypothetical protein|tara:strand:+ start:246 stop:380 length:135 start_codon:yes stop_codon:yes gene_type:complete
MKGKQENFTTGTFSKDFRPQKSNSVLRRARRRIERLENKLKEKV